MNRSTKLTLKPLVAACATLLALTAATGSPPAHAAGAPMKLTALDYIEIEQLSARYAFAIENCTNHGYER